MANQPFFINDIILQGLETAYTISTFMTLIFLSSQERKQKRYDNWHQIRLYKEDIFNPNPKDPNACGLSRKHILEAVEGSLKRLQTDYIDLYQVLLWIQETIGISRKMPSSLDTCPQPDIWLSLSIRFIFSIQ